MSEFKISLIFKACIFISLSLSFNWFSNSTILPLSSYIYFSNPFFCIFRIFWSFSFAFARTAWALVSSAIVSSALIKWYGFETSAGAVSSLLRFYLKAFLSSRIVSSSLTILYYWIFEFLSNILYCSLCFAFLSFSTLSSSIRPFILIGNSFSFVIFSRALLCSIWILWADTKSFLSSWF